MLNITNKSDYALLLLSKIISDDKFVSLSDLTSKTMMPKRFLARIASTLVKNKILESKEGKDGGYKLYKKLKDIDLYEFLKIFEGELNFVKCSKKSYCCRWDKICLQKNIMKNKLNRIVIKELQKLTLADLL